MNILAIQIGEPQTLGFGAVDTGLRSVLSVRDIVGKVQSTVFFGDTLHLLWNFAGQLDPQQAFVQFLKEFYNKPVTWAQLSAPPPNPLMQTRRIYLQPMPDAEPPVAQGAMTLLDAGYDPLRGYWCEFKGNFWLHIPVFRDFKDVTRVFE
jgi:hypothetical protein